MSHKAIEARLRERGLIPEPPAEYEGPHDLLHFLWVDVPYMAARVVAETRRVLHKRRERKRELRTGWRHGR